MMSLSVRQPYAELVASGRKPLEVRTWRVDYRGPLLIVASSNAYRDRFADFDLDDDDCPRSVAVCVVDLTMIAAEKKSRYSEVACCDVERGDYLWYLANPRRVAPFYVSGKLRLFPIDDAKIKVQR